MWNAGRRKKPSGHRSSLTEQPHVDDQFDDDFEEQLTSFLEESTPRFLGHSGIGDVTAGPVPWCDNSASDSSTLHGVISLKKSRLDSSRSETSTVKSALSDHTSRDFSRSPGVSKPAAAVCVGQFSLPSPISATPRSLTKEPEPAQDPLAVSTPHSGATCALLSTRLLTPGVAHSGLHTSGGSTPRKRTFPGPAGILPKQVYLDGELLKAQSRLPISLEHDDKQSSSPTLASSHVAQDIALTTQSSQVPCSYSSAIWQRMMLDLEIQEEDLRRHSISSVKCMASRRKLKGRKVSFLAAVIENLHVAIADASILLKDPTGEMHGTMLKQLIKEYPTQLRVGALIVLRQVAVFSPSTRRQYLNITPNNLLCIYNEDEASRNIMTCFGSMDTSNGILKSVVRKAVSELPFAPALRLRPDQCLPLPSAKMTSDKSKDKKAMTSQTGCGSGQNLPMASLNSRTMQLNKENVHHLVPPRMFNGNKSVLQTDRSSAVLSEVSAAAAKTLPVPQTRSIFRTAAVHGKDKTAPTSVPALVHSENQRGCLTAEIAEHFWQDCDWDELDLELP